MDVGCGGGFYLLAAHQRGWESYGVDLVPPFDYSDKKIQIFEGTLEEAHFPSGFFDACLMSHTLSHLLEPRQTLREAHRILDRQGILCVVVPKGFRQSESSLVKEFHLYLFNKKTARQLISESGFEIFEEGLTEKNSLKNFIRKLFPGSAMIFWARKGA